MVLQNSDLAVFCTPIISAAKSQCDDWFRLTAFQWHSFRKHFSIWSKDSPRLEIFCGNSEWLIAQCCVHSCGLVLGPWLAVTAVTTIAKTRGETWHPLPFCWKRHFHWLQMCIKMFIKHDKTYLQEFGCKKTQKSPEVLLAGRDVRCSKHVSFTKGALRSPGLAIFGISTSQRLALGLAEHSNLWRIWISTRVVPV